MFALVKAPQEVVAASVVGLDWYEIGPTDPCGWTAVWCPDPDDLSDAELDAVLGEWDVVTVAADWNDVVHASVRLDGHVTQGYAPWEAEAIGMTEVAVVLVEHFVEVASVSVEAREAVWAVDRFLTEIPDVPVLVQSLTFRLRWGATAAPQMTSAVLLHPQVSAASSGVVEMGARSTGPVQVTALDGGWTAHQLSRGEGAESVARIGGEFVAPDQVVVLLQRGPGAARIELHQGDRPLGAVTWDGWIHSEELGGWPAELVRVFSPADGPRLDVAEVAAAVEGLGPGDPLRRMTDLLDIPDRAVVLLDGPGVATYDETRGEVGALRFGMAAGRNTSAVQPWEMPLWAHVLWATATTVVMLFCLVVLLVFVEVLVTDGASWDEPSALPEDYGLTAVFGVLTPLLVWGTVRRWRRVGRVRRDPR